ncbi:MAG: protein kinase, partial [Prosthecobacter sp.]|nr:protein kinase [Prosthecobacter sp.]
NILINMEGQVKVADFGLAKAADAGQSGLTKTNMAMGTPDFVAPEALTAGVNIDGRADLYAIGVMLFNMLTGTVPRGMFRMPSVTAATDPRFDAIIVKAMEMDREMRYQTAFDIRRDLDVILSTPMVQAGGAASAAIPQLPQKPVAKGPQKRPTAIAGAPAAAAPPSAKDSSGAPKKQASLAPMLSIAATIAILAAGYFFFKPAPPSETAEATPTAPPVAEVKKTPTPRPPSPPPSQTKSGPISKGPLVAPGEVAKQTIDLLALMDPALDAMPPSATSKTDWARQNGTLVFKSAGGSGRLAAPAAWSSRDYLVEFRAELTAAKGHIILELPVGKGRVLPLLLNWQGHKTLNDQEGRAWIAGHGSLNIAARVSLSDRGLADHVRAEDRETGSMLADWTGSIQKLGKDAEPHPAFPGEPVCSLFVTDASYVIVRSWSLKVFDGDAKILRNQTPVAATTSALPPGAIDLMALVDVKRDARSGLWGNTPEGLSLRAETYGALEFQVGVPEEYDFEIEFTPQNKGNNVNQYLTAQGHSFAWKLNAHARTPPLYGFELLDGKFSKDNKEAATVFNKVLEPGTRYRSTVEVRKGSLRALLDGEEVLKWSGDYSRLSMEEGIKMHDPKHIGMGAYKRQVLFHSAVLRPISANAPTLATAPVAPAAPMVTATPVSATPDDPVSQRLATLEKQFLALYERDAGAAFNTSLAALNVSYTGALDRAMATATQAGKLDEVVAIRDEKQRITSGQGIPPADLETLSATLKAMRATYRQALAKLEEQRDKSALPLYNYYDQALARYQAELTQQQKIDDALRVKTKREEVSRKMPQADAGTGAGAAPAPLAPGLTKGSSSIPKSGDAQATGRSRWYEAARWVVSVGGHLRVVKNGTETGVDTLEEIPAGKFDVVSVTIDGNPKSANVKDDDFTRLSGLAIRYLRLSKLDLTDAAFAFLPTTPELQKILLSEVRVTDEIFSHMAPLQKLTELDIQTAPELTGTGLEKLASLPLLKTATFNLTGFTDAGVKSMAGAKGLEKLGLEATKITDEGLRGLGSFPLLGNLSLKNCQSLYGTTIASWEDKSAVKQLNLSFCPRLKAEALADIAGLTQLTELSVEFDNAVTDETLKALAPLTKLNRLNVALTPVTGTGLAALRACTNLTFLNVGGTTPISAAGLATIVESLPQLTTMHIGAGARLNAADYRLLTGLKTLKALEIGFPNLDDAMLAEIAQVSTLESLNVNYSAITAEGLRKLKLLKSLTRLIIGSCPAIDDSTIPDLKELKMLKTLDLYKSPVTAEGLAALKKALPGCKVSG